MARETGRSEYFAEVRAGINEKRTMIVFSSPVVILCRCIHFSLVKFYYIHTGTLNKLVEESQIFFAMLGLVRKTGKI